MRLLGQRPRYQEGPPEGADDVGKPPLGAGGSADPDPSLRRPLAAARAGTASASAPAARKRRRPAIPEDRALLGSRSRTRGRARRHAGSLEARRVTRPEAVAS